MAKIKVFKAKKTLSFQQKNLTPDDFYSDEIFTSMPDNILGSLDNISFFKPNKTILQGSVVSNMDVQPVNLVNYGVPVKVVLKNQNIGLTIRNNFVEQSFFSNVSILWLKMAQNASFLVNLHSGPPVFVVGQKTLCAR